ncbi:MAG: methyltransferase domain-containing protein [Archangium sp.]|nr:methyltransferase domain-containing protein [Archangium sp.]
MTSALDAGCGTGAAGAWMRPFARRLHGLDASPGMLALAAKRGVYDHLEVGDLLADAAPGAEAFDAVVLADVVPYFGALAPLFQALRPRLLPGGAVLACGERSDDPGFTLRPTGRYQHHADVVREAAAEAGLRVLALEESVLRNEGGAPVNGWYAVLRSA